MQLDPFVWFVVGSMTGFALVLGWATWFTRER